MNFATSVDKIKPISVKVWRLNVQYIPTFASKVNQTFHVAKLSVKVWELDLNDVKQKECHNLQ
jgi:hypothetical protein